MPKTKICALYFQDHRKHPIIPRQIEAYQIAGYDIAVVDTGIIQDEPSYTQLTAQSTQLTWMRTSIWRMARPLFFKRTGELYWTIIVCLEKLILARRIYYLAKSTQPELLQAHDLLSLLAAFWVKNHYGTKIIFDAHEIEPETGNPTDYINSCLRFLEKQLISKVDLLILPSETRADYYVHQYKLETKPVVIHNYPPERTWPSSSKLLELLELPETTKIVLYHGALIPNRSLERLIEASQYLNQDTVLVLIGDQDNSYFQNELKPLCKSKSVKNIYFLPYLPYDQVMPLVASADLGIVIYKNVNLNNYLCAPTKLYDYIMAGVPVAACDFPEIQLILNQYKIGVTFDPEDPQSIAKTFNDFFQLPESEISTIVQNITQIRSMFTWGVEQVELLKNLKQLLRSNSTYGDAN